MVKYNGIRCELYEHYFTDSDGPYVKIISPNDIQRAYRLGFTCMGYPNEIMKEITDEEYQALLIRNNREVV